MNPVFLRFLILHHINAHSVSHGTSGSIHQTNSGLLQALTHLTCALTAKAPDFRKLECFRLIQRSMLQTPHLKISHLAALALLLACGIAHVQVRAQICTREYVPVCGQKEQATPQIFANRCVMLAAQAQALPSSACAHLPQSQSPPHQLIVPAAKATPMHMTTDRLRATAGTAN